MSAHTTYHRLQCQRSIDYTIAPGDFCDGTPAAWHASTFQLANANPTTIDAACDNRWPGIPIIQLLFYLTIKHQVICLSLLGKDYSTTTVVEAGSGCDAITADAVIPISTLLHNNPNVAADCSNIYPGEASVSQHQVW
ncbi:hypothetical protein K435DRAFT_649668 [Dendrothele bispora CBS 962.96]|uniref:LysM domain-containing protein n=1 Tax=Dendrothele bispora (strain CBS 962.96) TaxID=1314807 RepID=A0A4S8MPN6_DENBC|nr:hypothetical protein K435DRAFT_649668 [Dendrothele bispora CBS 962.96]